MLTHALCASDVSGVSRFADAVVGAQSVEAPTVLAKVSHHTTLINVWKETRKVYPTEVYEAEIWE